MAGVTLRSFEPDRRKRWLVERGIEIISEASRRLPDELKARHPEIPWSKVAGIGNVLRHEYERIAYDVLRPAPPASRSTGGQRVDPAQRGDPCSVLGLPDRHGPIDAALTTGVAAGAAHRERVAEQDNRRNLLVGRAMP